MLRTDAIAVALLFAAAFPAQAAVLDATPNGFTIQIKVQVSASPGKVFAALVQPAKWWSATHTFSGDSANLSLDAKAGGCWCEKLPNGGSVAHLTVVYVDPGRLLRLRGALGPFQGDAVEGAMTWSLAARGNATDLTLEYALGGYRKDGLYSLSNLVDGVLTEQVANLKRAIESGSPGR
jgi:uncharacterized protein YndB with AHSA1/START domain